MARNDLFRIAIFGGYNKEDVQEYIKSLENEIETVKLLHQREKDDLLRQLEKRGNIPRPDPFQLKPDSDQPKPDPVQPKPEETRTAREDDEKWILARQQWEAEKDRLVHEAENARMENAKLQERLTRLEQNGQDKTKGIEKDFLDQEMISEVLKDARRNAELIVDEARHEAESIIAEAKKEAEEQKAEIIVRINSELEDKGIQLIAAKHKITQYMNEVKSTQEGLYNLYSRMNLIVSNMPVRVDNYWDGEHYRMLEDELKKEKENGIDSGDGAVHPALGKHISK